MSQEWKNSRLPSSGSEGRCVGPRVGPEEASAVLGHLVECWAARRLGVNDAARVKIHCKGLNLGTTE